MTKASIKARHINIETINCLIEEYKAHDQSSSHFPQDISDKVRRLNDDWQVILTLSSSLEDQTISEEILIEELVKESESAVTMFDNDALQEDTGINFFKEFYKKFFNLIVFFIIKIFFVLFFFVFQKKKKNAAY